MAKKGKPPSKPARFVLDCSVTMAWYFRDEATPYAKAVRKSLGSMAATVPMLWSLEVANVLVMGERRKRSTESDAAKWLEFLRTLPIYVSEEAAARAWSDVLTIARMHKLSAYDAAYIELALRLGLPLATLDDRLQEVASTAGLATFVPA